MAFVIVKCSKCSKKLKCAEFQAKKGVKCPACGSPCIPAPADAADNKPDGFSCIIDAPALSRQATVPVPETTTAQFKRKKDTFSVYCYTTGVEKFHIFDRKPISILRQARYTTVSQETQAQENLMGLAVGYGKYGFFLTLAYGLFQSCQDTGSSGFETIVVTLISAVVIGGAFGLFGIIKGSMGAKKITEDVFHYEIDWQDDATNGTWVFRVKAGQQERAKQVLQDAGVEVTKVEPSSSVSTEKEQGEPEN